MNMPATIINAFEVVNIQDGQADRRFSAPGPFHFSGQGAFEHLPASQARKVVVTGRMGQGVQGLVHAAQCGMGVPVQGHGHPVGQVGPAGQSLPFVLGQTVHKAKYDQVFASIVSFPGPLGMPQKFPPQEIQFCGNSLVKTDVGVVRRFFGHGLAGDDCG